MRSVLLCGALLCGTAPGGRGLRVRLQATWVQLHGPRQGVRLLQEHHQRDHRPIPPPPHLRAAAERRALPARREQSGQQGRQGRWASLGAAVHSGAKGNRGSKGSNGPIGSKGNVNFYLCLTHTSQVEPSIVNKSVWITDNNISIYSTKLLIYTKV